jgi:uncharacterized protein
MGYLSGMKHILNISLLVFVALMGKANAQDKGIFYEVTGNGITTPSYLYGTFHLVCPTDLVISDETKKAFARTQELYLELDMDEPTLMTEMQKAIMLPEGKTAKDYLSADEYAQLDTYLKSKLGGVGIGLMERFKPIGVMSMMYVTMLKCQPASYDLTFAQMASNQKKQVLGLERTQDQLAALDKCPLADQFKDLVEMTQKPDVAQTEFANMLAAYKSHDLARIQTIIRSSQFSGDMAEFEENMLNVRNANWIPVIEKAAQAQPTFFAFGAGHLIGDKGVINLLRRRGYTVRAVE